MYFQLLVKPKSDFHVERFFSELSGLLEDFYEHLMDIPKTIGRSLTDVCFQFRFSLWWKFFGPKELENAVELYNDSLFLKKTLGDPGAPYSSRKLLYFVEKLGTDHLQAMQEKLIHDFFIKGYIRFTTLIVDSFPVKSFLNTQKCLKKANIDYQHLKQFLESIDLSSILSSFNITKNSFLKFETKLKVLLVKELWDIQSWNECWDILFGKKAIKHQISLPYFYKSVPPLKGIQNYLESLPNYQKIEQSLINKTAQVLVDLKLKDSSWHPKTFRDLNNCWHKSHRWKDAGISLFHCAAKNSQGFGRGGLIAIIKDLELPIFIDLTPKYKQSRDVIITFFQHLFFKFSIFFENVKILADSEFGFSNLRRIFEVIYNGNSAIPNYGNSSEKINLSEDDKNDRKMVERVIARLVNNWYLETPTHLGATYAQFHLQMAILCDLLQVCLNLQFGNYGHPHSLQTIIGKKFKRRF